MVDPISLPVQGPNSATNCVARTIIVGIGANLGDRLATLTRVGGLLPALGPVVAVASLYESDAVGPPQDRYWNTAVHLRSSATAPALVAAREKELAFLNEWVAAFHGERRAAKAAVGP
jgi:hypothetical protein